MSPVFAQELEAFRMKLLRMADLAEQAVHRAVTALVNRDDGLARQVDEDETLLDQHEMEIDGLAIRLLSQTPPNSDLRFITTAMKISHNLERIGDEASTIARRVLELNEQPSLRDNFDLPKMAQAGVRMLKDALDAFLNQAPDRARILIPKDKEVDAMNKQLHRELASYMAENPATISRCLSLMVVSKSLERIADYATNIAEEVVYLCEGQDIRHQKKLKRPAAPEPPNSPAL